jgi:hypothetical protein
VGTTNVGFRALTCPSFIVALRKRRPTTPIRTRMGSGKITLLTVSVPTLDLAAHLHHIRAVILHSAVLSGLRVMYSVKKTYWFDIYKVCFTA